MENPYNPVDIGFQDKLEALAAENKRCEVIYFNAGGRVAVFDSIECLSKRDEAVYLEMESGLQIRLDQLIQVNGILAQPVC